MGLSDVRLRDVSELDTPSSPKVRINAMKLISFEIPEALVCGVSGESDDINVLYMRTGLIRVTD